MRTPGLYLAAQNACACRRKRAASKRRARLPVFDSKRSNQTKIQLSGPAGVYCSSGCACLDCTNSVAYQGAVLTERQRILTRCPEAFAPKVGTAPMAPVCFELGFDFAGSLTDDGVLDDAVPLMPLTRH